MKRTELLLASILLCANTAAPAQESASATPAPTDETIVVSGKTEAPPRKDVYDQALKLSRFEGRPGLLYDRALARFETPVCPGVYGLKARYGQMMIDRIRANAARLRVPLAKGGCSPNLIVAIVEDGQSLLTRLQRNRPDMFRLVSAGEKTELVEEGPVRVWSNVELVLRNGAPIPEGMEVPSIWGQMDRKVLPTRTDIHSALVVFDEKAVTGMSLTQLADYATMRGLTHTRAASGDEPMATILALFDKEGGGVAELTSFDLGYLRSLYFWIPNSSAVGKLLNVRHWAEKTQAEEARAAAKAREQAAP